MNSYMQAPLIPIQIERESPSHPWGFRLQGGADFKLTLSIKKVTQNSPAYNHLHAGDVLIGINGRDATMYTHQQAFDEIKNSGYQLNLMVRKGQYSLLKPVRPATKFNNQGVPVQNAYKRF